MRLCFWRRGQTDAQTTSQLVEAVTIKFHADHLAIIRAKRSERDAIAKEIMKYYNDPFLNSRISGYLFFMIRVLEYSRVSCNEINDIVAAETARQAEQMVGDPVPTF